LCSPLAKKFGDPAALYERLSQSVLLRCRQEDISQNVVVTSLVRGYENLTVMQITAVKHPAT